MSSEEQRPSEQVPEDSPRQPGDAHQAPAFGQPNFEEMPDLAIKVVTDPIGFYREMPRSGGLIEPLIFMVILAVVAGVLSALFSLFGLGMAGAMTGGLIAIFLMPVFVVIIGFVGATIAHVIWRVMGSQETFETSFRCVAYAAAIAPVTTVLKIVPYIGSMASALWTMALLAIASIYVHRRNAQTSWTVFGVLGLLFALMSVNSERTSRQFMSSMEDWREVLEERRE